MERVFVTVVGFSDEERHALNVLFRLSEEHEGAFSLWEPYAPGAPRLAIIDGQSQGAQAEAESPRNADVAMIWVGPDAPQRAARVYQRPIAWGEVVQAMDELFPVSIDFDLGLDPIDTEPPDTQPPDTMPPDMPPRRRALIAAADRDERLYLRARLSLADITQADEAENAAQALELARDNQYVLAVVDFRLPGAHGWDFLRELSHGQRPVTKVIVTASRPSLVDRVRARFSPATGFFVKPPDPGKLHDALLHV